MPVIVVGGFRSLDTMEAVLNQTKIEMISLSRPLLREPDLPNRILRDPSMVSRCISCNRCYSSPSHKVTGGGERSPPPFEIIRPTSEKLHVSLCE